MQWTIQHWLLLNVFISPLLVFAGKAMRTGVMDGGFYVFVGYYGLLLAAIVMHGVLDG